MYKILNNIVASPSQQYFEQTTYNQLKFQTIHSIQQYHKASFFIQIISLQNSYSHLIPMYKILNNIVASPSQQYFKPAKYNQLKFQTIHSVEQYHKASFFIQVISLWNSYPPSLVRAQSLDEFRREMVSYKLPQIDPVFMFFSYLKFLSSVIHHFNFNLIATFVIHTSRFF